MRVTNFGNGKTKIGVVGCQHGDELLGKQIINRLMPQRRGPNVSLKLLIANEEAMAQNKHFVQSDLNRSFPGREVGTIEQELAFKIRQELQDCTFVIDIHSTWANMADAIIVTSGIFSNPLVRHLIDKVPIEKVLVMKGNEIGGGSSLIDHTNAGVALEFSRRVPIWQATKVVESTILNIEGDASAEVVKDIFYVNGFLDSVHGDKVKMENFRPVRKGDLIIERAGRPISAEFDFTPIFVGESSYKDKACMIAIRQ